MNPTQRSEFLRKEANRLGFTQVGISKAERLDNAAIQLEKWLAGGYHGQMKYMENHFEKRVDPRKLVPGAKSVISLLYNYYTPQKQKDNEAPKISMYALGEDYHHVIKKQLRALVHKLQVSFGDFAARIFVDSAPVMEREWAARGGLGWIGRHTLAIHPRKGSYFFLAEIILDIDFEYDQPIRDHCGTCTKCIDACPTQAISSNGYVLDASRCISYLTIELKEAIPAEFENQMDQWMFGCDVCQQVCPWNRFSEKHQEASFEPKSELLEMTKRDWLELTQEVFRDLFGKSAVKRT
ncbi:MAG: tRNA epoxyqueuosine(34) reductase QueG [Bacteroidia bacterium]|nr:tRNA epoxyqueuosine(34) reductase QueG [Bacteroidia bacterium]